MDLLVPGKVPGQPGFVRPLMYRGQSRCNNVTQDIDRWYVHTMHANVTEIDIKDITLQNIQVSLLLLLIYVSLLSLSKLELSTTLQNKATEA